jgi:uncharacterized protein with ParB-like and HNH nuclease domain
LKGKLKNNNYFVISNQEIYLINEKIEGTQKTIRELFTGVKYTIHYYQREYQWQTKQIEELLVDLT